MIPQLVWGILFGLEYEGSKSSPRQKTECATAKRL